MAATKLTPAQQSAHARVMAHMRWAREDPAVQAAAGQAGLKARFDREAREAEPGLTDAEYARRAEHLYKAHMSRISRDRSKAISRAVAGDD